MSWKFLAIAASAAAVLLAPAPAWAQGDFHVRNDTRRTLSCGLRREHGSMVELFVLRAGGGWTQPAASGAARLLICDVNRLPLRARLRPGVDYVLAEDSATGRVTVRIAGGR